ncbi:MAG: sialate O-acetylesterase [Planctomycetota bacterium]|nr:sialate O-acetylesterase [Planctomycetota bacterium]
MMMNQRRASIVGVMVLVLAGAATADVTLPSVFGHHMVMQRGRELPVWGRADPGERVSVSMAGNTTTAVADEDGAWMVRLPAMSAGGPHAMIINGENRIRFEDILIGEVWICSGQSNMEWPVSRSNDAEREIASADHRRIRLFDVPRRPSGLPRDDVDAAWKVCAPETIGGFSAVAYFFGRELLEELDVPTGLVNTSWGGTRIEPWTPLPGFAAIEETRPIVGEIRQANRLYRRSVRDALDDMEAWVANTRDALDSGESITPLPLPPPHPLNGHRQPTGLYNGMVHPLVPFAIRGAIWYQGEANRGDGSAYAAKMRALIAGWRAVWDQGEFPFYYVQLAPFRYGGDPYLLPLIWEAQTDVLSVPNTAMAVINDIGNLRDIHPRNKQDVGKRLALWALAKTYDRDAVVYCGPMYRSMVVEGDRIRLRFDHIGGGLTARDDQALTWFEIAGADGNYVKANAEIDGDTVIVSGDAVPQPVSVRFAWHQEAEPNLMNEEGLPAAPFRTDR